VYAKASIGQFQIWGHSKFELNKKKLPPCSGPSKPHLPIPVRADPVGPISCTHRIGPPVSHTTHLGLRAPCRHHIGVAAKPLPAPSRRRSPFSNEVSCALLFKLSTASSKNVSPARQVKFFLCFNIPNRSPAPPPATSCPPWPSDHRFHARVDTSTTAKPLLPVRTTLSQFSSELDLTSRLPWFPSAAGAISDHRRSLEPRCCLEAPMCYRPSAPLRHAASRLSPHPRHLAWRIHGSPEVTSSGASQCALPWLVRPGHHSGPSILG
jgi:hypothetical protein